MFLQIDSSRLVSSFLIFQKKIEMKVILFRAISTLRVLLLLTTVL